MGKCLSKQGKSKEDGDVDKAPYVPSPSSPDHDAGPPGKSSSGAAGHGDSVPGKGDRPSVKVAEVAPQIHLDTTTPDSQEETPELPVKTRVSAYIAPELSTPELPEKKRDSRIPSGLDVIPPSKTSEDPNDDEDVPPSLPEKSAELVGNLEEKKEEVMVKETHLVETEIKTSPPQTTEVSSWSTTPSGGKTFTSVSTSHSSGSRIVHQEDVKVEMRKSGNENQNETIDGGITPTFESLKTMSLTTASAVSVKRTSEKTTVITTSKITDGEKSESVIQSVTSSDQESNKEDIKSPFSTTAPEGATILSVKDVRNQRSEPVTKPINETKPEDKEPVNSEQPMALLGALKYLKSPPANGGAELNGEPDKQNPESLDKNGVATDKKPPSPVSDISDTPVKLPPEKRKTSLTGKSRVNGVSGLPVPNGNSPDKKHIEAKVIVKPDDTTTNGKGGESSTDELSDPRSSDKDDAVDFGIYDDYTHKMDDHTIMRNLKRRIKGLLYDFSPYNDAVRQKHELTPNTRNKLLQAVDRWFLSEDSERPRVMVITGAVGIGKTCVATELCKKYENRMAGYHFFSFNSSNIDHNTLRAVILSLAYRFCDVFPNYISMLPLVEKLRELLSQGDISDLYNALLFTPLSDPALDHDSDKHMLIVLDALDECNLEDREILLDVIKNINENSPEWLYLLATTRNENQILGHLDGVYSVEIKRSNENMSDIKKYLRQPLGQFMDRISLDGGLNQLVKKTEGLFLCGYILGKRLEQFPREKIALREVDHMYQSGLTANCNEMFLEFRESLAGTGAKKNAYRNILSILMAAREPLHTDFLASVVGKESAADVRISLEAIAPVLITDDDHVSFCSKRITEWLMDEAESGECHVDGAVGHEQLAILCVKWLGNIIGENETATVPHSLQSYAMKHVIYHLLDVPKQQENVAKVLCSLRYIQDKLNLPGVRVSHVLHDYHHRHIQTYKGTTRLITLKDYMKKHPKTMEHIAQYEKFVIEKKLDIQQCPQFLLHVAANYPQVERIQSNARLELEDKPWLQDVTAIPETHCITKNLGGSIRAADVSPDGKSVAAISKDEEYNVRLHIINTTNGDPQVTPIDIKPLNDRVGLQSKFMPDGNNIFVGSLTTFINKQGKKVNSGLDVTNIELKEKFSIECCGASPRHFVCGLTTFPWGGRSLHLVVFDVRTKKCLKTIEVLRFRFGGSAQFGIKAIAVAKDVSLMSACVKQSTKPQLRVVVWNISKFQVVNSIDINNEHITKCLFVGDHTLLLGSSIRSTAATKSSATFVPVVSETWHFKEVTNKVSQVWDEKEAYSLLSSHGEVSIACRWYNSGNTALIQTWASPKINKKPSSMHKLRGLTEVAEILSGDNMLVFVSHDEISMYNMEDLEALPVVKGSSVIPSLNDVNVHSLAFLPRTDSVALTIEEDGLYSVYLCDLSEEDATLVPTPFIHMEKTECQTAESEGQFRCFLGPGASSELCFPSADGNSLIFNTGDQLKVWDKVKNTVKDIPKFDQLKDVKPDFKEFTGIKGFASTKDNILAVVYGQTPQKVYIYDVKSGLNVKTLEQVSSLPKKHLVTDIVFLPSNGFLMTYHRHMDNGLSAWNARTGEMFSTASVHISYGKASPASDRIVISARKVKHEGQLILRNSDNKFSKTLFMGSHHSWLPSCEHSDVEFSEDGTILVGVCAQTSVCRVWNAGNGEVLQDLPNSFTADTEIVGLLTNTHILFSSDHLLVLDVASGETTAVLPLDHQMAPRYTKRGLRISHKSSIVAGATASGRICVFHSHNFITIKRKTTLQRMKSFKN